jgi:hypothetical protein
MLKLLNDKYTRVVSPQLYEGLSRFDMVGAGVMLSPNQVRSAPPMENSPTHLQAHIINIESLLEVPSSRIYCP